MYEEGVIKWESILTILIGIVIVAFIFLIIYRIRKVNSKKIERKIETHKNNRNKQKDVVIKTYIFNIIEIIPLIIQFSFVCYITAKTITNSIN